MAIAEFVLLFFMVMGIFYFSVPRLIGIIALGIFLVIFTFLGHLSFLVLIPSWLLYLTSVALCSLTAVRQKYVVMPIYKKMKNAMPPISQTEQEAIEGGDVWWDKDLFSGKPQWKKLLAFPKPKLSADEQHFLDNSVETLCSMLDEWHIMQEAHDLPPAVWDYLKTEGFFGMVIPKAYGGLGFSALLHSTVVIKIGTRCISAAVNAMVPNSLGPGELLLHYGTQAQKDYYLPRLARGIEIPCFALTGPEAGSDAGSITDHGTVCKGMHGGKETLGIRLTWDKRYITLAPVATLLGLAFRLFDPDHLLGEKDEIGITVCLIPTTHPGVEIGNRHYPMYLAFMNGPTRGNDVFIPLEWVVGGAAMAGHGWRMLMECLSIGRSISLPALSTACGKFAYRVTGAYAQIRKQFKMPIAQFEGIMEPLSTIAGYTYMLEATRLLTVGAVDQNIRPAIPSAIAKYHLTEISRKVIDCAMDIHGGHAIQAGPRNVLLNAYLGLPISITVEGANILMRNLVIFGQGAIRCHPYILQEIKVFSQPETLDAIQQFDTLLLGHVGYTLRNLARTIVGGLLGGKLFHSPVRGRVARYYRQLTRMSAALALLADMSMLVLGGNLKRRERISARLGDMLSNLYLASATLKYYHDQGQTDTDFLYVRWSVETCLHHIQIAIDEWADNFPLRWLAKALYVLIFPFGRAYRKPNDALSHSLIKPMMTPSDFRERLANFCYMSPLTDDPVNRLERGLRQVQTVDALTEKMKAAVRHEKVKKQGSYEEQVAAAVAAAVLTPDQANVLLEFNQLKNNIVKVNEFSFDLRTILN